MDNHFKVLSLCVRALSEYTGKQFIPTNQEALIEFPKGFISIVYFSPENWPSKKQGKDADDNDIQITEVLYKGEIKVSYFSKESTGSNAKANLKDSLDTIASIVTGWQDEDFKHIWEIKRREVDPNFKCSILNVEQLVPETQIGRERGQGTFYAYSTILKLSYVDRREVQVPCIEQDSIPIITLNSEIINQ